MVKIRLQRRGRTHAPFYSLVVADSKAPRDGRFLEKVGTYNPMRSQSALHLVPDKILYWIEKGAQPTETARTFLSAAGIMLLKHLKEGVTKGAITKKTAHGRFSDWKKVVEERKKPKFAITTSVALESIIDVLQESTTPFIPKIKKDKKRPAKVKAAKKNNKKETASVKKKEKATKPVPTKKVKVVVKEEEAKDSTTKNNKKETASVKKKEKAAEPAPTKKVKVVAKEEEAKDSTTKNNEEHVTE